MDQEMPYRLKADTAIRDLLLEFECQPILFVGSGLSRRYFGAPAWHDLLRILFSSIPNGEQIYQYNLQKYDGNPLQIGSILSDSIFEWAWKEGKENFPKYLFLNNYRKDLPN